MIVSDWLVAKPESVGLRNEPLDALVKWLDWDHQANIHGIVVVRHGKLLFEHYRMGEDECWGEPLGNVIHGPESKHDLRSVTKSVTSLLLGIALERKLIGSIDDPVLGWFPEYADLRTPEKERISLRHLLTMSAGFEWNENVPASDPRHSEIRMLMSDDQHRYALEQPIVSPPGQVWNYNSGGSALLGAVVGKAAGSTLDEVAREFLLGRSALPTSRGPGRRTAGFPKLAVCGCAQETRQELVSLFSLAEIGTGARSSRATGSKNPRPHISVRRA
jgi:hypothetical protein